MEIIITTSYSLVSHELVHVLWIVSGSLRYNVSHRSCGRLDVSSHLICGEGAITTRQTGHKLLWGTKASWSHRIRCETKNINDYITQKTSLIISFEVP